MKYLAHFAVDLAALVLPLNLGCEHFGLPDLLLGELRCVQLGRVELRGAFC